MKQLKEFNKYNLEIRNKIYIFALLKGNNLIQKQRKKK